MQTWAIPVQDQLDPTLLTVSPIVANTAWRGEAWRTGLVPDGSPKNLIRPRRLTNLRLPAGLVQSDDEGEPAYRREFGSAG